MFRKLSVVVRKCGGLLSVEIEIIFRGWFGSVGGDQKTKIDLLRVAAYIKLQRLWVQPQRSGA